MRPGRLVVFGIVAAGCDGSLAINALMQVPRPGEVALNVAALQAATGIYETTTWLRSVQGCPAGTSLVDEPEKYFVVAYEPDSSPPAAWMSTCLDEASCQGMLDAVASGGRPSGSVVGWVNASNGGSRGVGTLLDAGVVDAGALSTKCEDVAAFQASFGSTSGGEAAFDVTRVRATRPLKSPSGECTVVELLGGLAEDGTCAQFDTINGLPL